MQKLRIAIFLILLIFTINCSDKKSQLPEEIKIAVTLPPFADFVKNIVANRVEIITLVPPGTNAHSYEPTPGDIKNLLNSNIYFRVGKSFKLEEIIFSKVLQTTKTCHCQREDLLEIRRWDRDKRYDVSKSGLGKAKTIGNSKTRDTNASESNR